ncbi:23 kDa integral membrane protein-like [Scaptodrosophila lebanonensis]|uniref:23 kDa integral membrane protein-like n=1 Tax=Drosophila lebanonensis TaxID=7225 RepID=A0A6J2UK89_DROLE|nr:23 kDa integral membrane protein-like [Scaptodrosophila lebanonensis]
MSCGTKTLKVSSFLLDFLCCVFGAFTISACSYALATYSGSEAIRIPCILGIVLGVLLFGITILGCIAALQENIRLTWIYAAVLFALICAQITVMFVQPINFPLLASETIDRAWHNQLYLNGSMSYYEIKYHCCGKTGPDNYPDSGLKIPASCYFNQNSTIQADLFQFGCKAPLAVAFSKGTRMERISDWTVVGVEILAVIVAGLLAITLRHAARRRPYR